jgi:hypothetical protein
MVKRALPVVGLVAVVGLIVVLYRPALDLELIGDDYQWLQLAHAAVHRPALLLADLDTFYRPLSTWTLVADRALWGHAPSGYHLTNVLLQALAAALLALAARRLALPWACALAVGLLWGASPFTTEPALSVAIRFENLLLLAWLGLVLAWPDRGQAWTSRRAAVVAGLAAAALFAKETWVVTPALVWLLERSVHGASPRQAVRTAAPFAAAAALYAVLYFAAFPGGKSYYHLGAAALAKVPHQLAAFLWLEQLRPIDVRLTAAGVLAALVTGAVLVIGFRRGDAATAVGAGLLLLPTLPTLFVPYLPTRYTAIPYAGFLLVAGAGATALIGGLRGTARRLASLGAGALVAAVLAAGALTVRADLGDLARVSDAHRRLLDQARPVAATVASGAPVAVVRAERNDPLLEIALSVRGLPKLFFPRPEDPDGLVDAAALFEWALAREGTGVRRLAAPPPATSGVVLIHGQGGFAGPVATADIAGAARAWRDRGAALRLIRAVPLDRPADAAVSRGASAPAP